MAFKMFDQAELEQKFPVVVGKKGKPSMSVADNGRVTFSAEVSAALAGCLLVVPSFDSDGKDTNRLRLDGHEKPLMDKDGKTPSKKFKVELVHPKGVNGKAPKSKNIGMPGTMLMKAIGYDYKAAGNQTFDVEKFDIEKHIVIISMPKVTPTPKPKQERKKKAETPATPAAPAAPAASGPQAVPPAAKAAAAGVDPDLVVEE